MIDRQENKVSARYGTFLTNVASKMDKHDSQENRDFTIVELPCTYTCLLRIGYALLQTRFVQCYRRLHNHKRGR